MSERLLPRALRLGRGHTCPVFFHGRQRVMTERKTRPLQGSVEQQEGAWSVLVRTGEWRQEAAHGNLETLCFPPCVAGEWGPIWAHLTGWPWVAAGVSRLGLGNATSLIIFSNLRAAKKLKSLVFLSITQPRQAVEYFLLEWPTCSKMESL